MKALLTLRLLLVLALMLVALNGVGLVLGYAGLKQSVGVAPREALAADPPAIPAATPPAEPAPDAAAADALRNRRQALDAREQSLATREALLAVAEQQIDARLNELAALQGRLEQAETAARQREDSHWRSQAKLYEAMRPREAAAVFNELDLPVLVEVVQRMTERKAAPILGAMLPARVRQLTVELARLRAGHVPAGPNPGSLTPG